MDAKKINATGSLFTRGDNIYVYSDKGINAERCVVVAFGDREFYFKGSEVVDFISALRWAYENSTKQE